MKQRFFLTVKIQTVDGVFETEPIADFDVPVVGPEAFTIKELNVYQGEKGKEVFIKSFSVSDEIKSNKGDK